MIVEPLAYRVGRSLLWQGEPFRLAVLSKAPRVDITILGKQAFLSQPAGVHQEGRHLFEIGTDIGTDNALPAPGDYDIQIWTSARESIIEERLIVLPVNAYHALRVEEAQEKFLPSPGLRPELAPRFVSRIMDDWLAADDRHRLRLDCRVLETAREYLLPASAIRWVTECVVEEFCHLGVFGVRRADWKLTLEAPHFTLGVSADLLAPGLSQRVLAAAERSDVGALTNLGALPDLKVERLLKPDYFELAVHFGVDGIALAPELPEPA